MISEGVYSYNPSWWICDKIKMKQIRVAAKAICNLHEFRGVRYVINEHTAEEYAQINSDVELCDDDEEGLEHWELIFSWD